MPWLGAAYQTMAWSNHGGEEGGGRQHRWGSGAMVETREAECGGLLLSVGTRTVVLCYVPEHPPWSFAMRRDTRSGLFAMRRNMPSCLFAMRRDTHSGLFSKCRTCTVVFLLYTGTQTHTRGRVRGARCRRIFAMHRDCLLAHHPGPWAAQEQTIAAQKAHCTAKTQ